MPQIWGMFRDQSALMSCVRECAAHARVSVLLPKNAPPGIDRVVVLGPLTRLVSPYPFLDIPHHLRRLGIDRDTASRYTDGLSRGWCIVCIEGLPHNRQWTQYPLKNAAVVP